MHVVSSSNMLTMQEKKLEGKLIDSRPGPEDGSKIVHRQQRQSTAIHQSAKSDLVCELR